MAAGDEMGQLLHGSNTRVERLTKAKSHRIESSGSKEPVAAVGELVSTRRSIRILEE